MHYLHPTGLPLFELSSKADEALRMALDEINARYSRHYLYRVSKATVTRVGGMAHLFLPGCLQWVFNQTILSRDLHPLTLHPLKLQQFLNTGAIQNYNWIWIMNEFVVMNKHEFFHLKKYSSPWKLNLCRLKVYFTKTFGWRTHEE